MSAQAAQQLAMGISNLSAELWEVKGYQKANVVLSNDAAGNLVITFSALTERSYARLKTNPAMSNGTVRAIMIVEGMDTTADVRAAGPGMRLSGTDGSNNMSGYGLTIRRAGTVGGDPYSLRVFECTAGAAASMGSESATVVGAHGAYFDLALTVATNGANADVSATGRLENNAAADFTQGVVSDTTPRTGTDYGIYLGYCTTAFTVRVKFFEVY